MHSSLLFAQQSNIKFDRIGYNDGLSQSDVTSIVQDYRGLIWMGTKEGLNLYNGFEFITFTHDILDSSSISNSVINYIYEDTDSNLWIGTDNGINLFDRASQTFSKYLTNSNNTKNKINSITEDANKNLWVATTNKIYKLTKSEKNVGYTLQLIKLPLSIINTNLNFVKLVFLDGNELVIASENNGIFFFNPAKNAITQFTTENSILKSNTVWDIKKDIYNIGYLGIATNKGINLYNTKNQTIIKTPELDAIIGNKKTKTIYEDKTGIIWIGTEDEGLFKLKSLYNADHYEYSASVSSSINSNKINIVLEDCFGIIWIGTEAGVNKFDKQRQFFKHFQHWPNLPNTIVSNMVLAIFQDKNENLYIGSDHGLTFFDNSNNNSAVHLEPNPSAQKSKKNQNVYCIVQDYEGRIYIGSDVGIFQFIDTSLIPLSTQNQLKFSVYSLIVDKNNRLWAATDEGVYVFFKDRTVFSSISENKSIGNKLPSNIVNTIYQTKNGTIWLGTEKGLCKVNENENGFTLKIYQKNESNLKSLNNNNIQCIFEDKDENLWLGTLGGGLNKLNSKTDEFVRFTEKEGLSNNNVLAILSDSRNNLWISTNKGISFLNTVKNLFRNFEDSDGLQGNSFNKGAYFKNKFGEIFFGGTNGFNSFYPDEVKRNNSTPLPIITNFYLFNKLEKIGKNAILTKHIAELDEITLEYKQNVISFEFASLHYSFPLKNKHAYMLENFDEDWVYVDNNRRANYTNLNPGEYLFKVKVANNDGVWGDKIAQIRVIVKPPFWATWWFRLIGILLIMLLIYGYIMSRINNVKSQKLLLELQVRERTYEVIKQKEEIEEQKKLIESEKEKADQLLYNILPEEIAIELKNKGKATARQYRLASIMFTDFIGFTKIAEKISPQNLVEELDYYFVNFDAIIEKYHIEKIKTIGDAYMCAGGIPVRNKTNPIDIVLAGLEIQRFVQKLNPEREAKGKIPWGLRIGIHTGEITAGVIGSKRFAYDIWGDSVNIGSRMEEAGEVGRVNISGDTYRLIKEFFVCEYRGKIKAKNKGLIEMYFVNGIREELSVDGAGIYPNSYFKKYVDLHVHSGINYRKSELFILNKLMKELPNNLYYHDINHTKDVCAAVERLALLEGVLNDDIFLLKTAALYHDAGFINQYSNNEEYGALLASETLPQFGYTQEQISIICELISVTKIPHKPKNHLQEIMCDADLDYLGGDNYYLISDKLKLELMDRSIINSEKDWDELQINFLESHNFFTQTAIKLRQINKEKRLAEIKSKVKNQQNQQNQQNQ